MPPSNAVSQYCGWPVTKSRQATKAGSADIAAGAPVAVTPLRAVASAATPAGAPGNVPTGNAAAYVSSQRCAPLDGTMPERSSAAAADRAVAIVAGLLNGDPGLAQKYSSPGTRNGEQPQHCPNTCRWNGSVA